MSLDGKQMALAFIPSLETEDSPPPGPTIAVRTLLHLDAVGGHSEACSETHRLELTALMDSSLVKRVTYKAGLVIYEITEAGRTLSRGWQTAEKERACHPKTNKPSGH